MTWERRSQGRDSGSYPGLLEFFPELLEGAPVMALLIDAQVDVIALNQQAADFFGADRTRLPASLLEVTREARLSDFLASEAAEEHLRLVHRPSWVSARRVRASGGLRLLYLIDDTRLRQLEVVRSEFVANLSHELKTPLTSLRLAAESLQAELPEQTRQRFAQRVMAECDHLALMVDNLRALAQLEAGARGAGASTFDLAELILETARRLRLDPEPELDLPPAMAVRADRARLGQVLSSLLDNAFKFGRAEVPIEVAARTAGSAVTITVRDRGPGISPEHSGRVFERFYKIDPSRTRGVTGSGLGLSIARHLVLAMDGRIWTEPAPGGGQIFGLELPEAAITSA
ncbi:MAG TPA: HAMP domain-containing sensor histidine kinase [Candidatus Nitrosotalea sp.]|nr:HAMP domain-containing sensor histidine kinase [Candidatus Nitrosotalea sp.]